MNWTEDSYINKQNKIYKKFCVQKQLSRSFAQIPCFSGDDLGLTFQGLLKGKLIITFKHLNNFKTKLKNHFFMTPFRQQHSKYSTISHRNRVFQQMTLIWPFKVTEGQTDYSIRSATRDFLLSFHCNYYSPISNRNRVFQQMTLIWPFKVTQNRGGGGRRNNRSSDNCLVPFSKYSTSKFSGFDLDLWRSQEFENIFSIQKPIHDFLSNFYWHFITISYRFRDIRLQSFQGLTFDLRKSPKVENNVTIWKPIHDFLSNFHWHLLSIVRFSRYSRYSTSKFLGFDLDLWLLEVTRGRKYFHHSKAHTWLPI